MSLLLEPVDVARVQCKLVHLLMQSSSRLLILLSIQLVERFYDPLSGGILLDGQPISELNVREYRKNLALVSQEPVSIHHL
jgi:ABC-type transport system involved in Fe-S cluster assembly fused permease/ATPase subunit